MLILQLLAAVPSATPLADTIAAGIASVLTAAVPVGVVGTVIFMILRGHLITQRTHKEIVDKQDARIASLELTVTKQDEIIKAERDRADLTQSAYGNYVNTVGATMMHALNSLPTSQKGGGDHESIQA